MNKSVKNLRIKTISIVCASLAFLALIIGLAFASLTPSKADTGAVTISFTQVATGFNYPNDSKENYDTSFVVQILNNDNVVYSNVVEIKDGNIPSSLSISGLLEQGTPYVLQIVAPTFAEVSISSSTAGSVYMSTNSYDFTMAATVSFGVRFSLTQETWFSDSNVF